LCVFQGLVRQGQLFYSDSIVEPRKGRNVEPKISNSRFVGNPSLTGLRKGCP
jgi:hypothetical protein